ncbi:MAG: hypothetical protein U5R31_07570 [Acidimicrobiia bacterium]|nr:hypothetical protein [Acidimicrobiia bacterium]
MKRRIAEHAVDLTVAFPLLDRYEEIMDQIPEEVRTDVGSFADAGRRMVGTMLDHAHGGSVPSASLPSTGELNQWRAAANLAVGGLYMADPQFVDHYASTLPPNHRNLVTSMIQWSQNALAHVEPRDPPPRPADEPAQVPSLPTALADRLGLGWGLTEDGIQRALDGGIDPLQDRLDAAALWALTQTFTLVANAEGVTDDRMTDHVGGYVMTGYVVGRLALGTFEVPFKYSGAEDEEAAANVAALLRELPRKMEPLLLAAGPRVEAFLFGLIPSEAILGIFDQDETTARRFTYFAASMGFQVAVSEWQLFGPVPLDGADD